MSLGEDYLADYAYEMYHAPREQRKQTNADRIRATTDEELAELFYSYGICPPEWRREPCNFSTCKSCILCWLKRETKA